jgi:oxygen-dependent protoporphyrinogen oxidase
VKAAIVGAGISGLATAQAILARDPEAELSLFEASERVGGKVETEITPEGYLCEWGVNAFLDKSPRTLELCTEVGLSPVRGDESAKRRYVYSEGELHKLPDKPPEFLASRLLSWRGRLRVFAGDASRLSLKSCFPRMRELEAEHGSLIRALIRLQKQARRAGSKDTPGPAPGGMLTSFAGGMSELTDTLGAQLGSRIRLATAVEEVGFENGRFQLKPANGSPEAFDVVVAAAPAWAQARMLRDLSPTIAGELETIPYPPVAVVCLGYDRSSVGPGVDGFGFLVPSRERRHILGTVVDSNVFPNRAPAGKILLRTLMGGARSPGMAELPDEQMLQRVLTDLKDITGIAADPEFVSIYRHERAIPQYLVGHAGRLARIDEELARFPGLVLTGNAFRGVSLNDCVLNALHTARSVVPDEARDGERQP